MQVICFLPLFSGSDASFMLMLQSDSECERTKIKERDRFPSQFIGPGNSQCHPVHFGHALGVLCRGPFHYSHKQVTHVS